MSTTPNRTTRGRGLARLAALASMRVRLAALAGILVLAAVAVLEGELGAARGGAGEFRESTACGPTVGSTTEDRPKADCTTAGRPTADRPKVDCPKADRPTLRPAPLAPPTYGDERAGRPGVESEFRSGSAARSRRGLGQDLGAVYGSRPGAWAPSSSREGATGFMGVPFNGWAPPDPHLAVGPDHVLLSTNGSLVVRSKSGDLLFETNLEGPNGFWGALGTGSFVFDPEVAYDPAEGRFYVVAAERVSVLAGYLLLGVSATSDPTGPWHKYRFDVTPLANSWDVDSPNLALGADALYLTADFFQPVPAHLVVTMEKATVMAGDEPVLRSLLHTGSQSFGLAGARMDGSRPYLVEHFEDEPATQVRLWAIDDPLGAPTLVSFVVDVPSYAEPGVLRSLGTTMEIPLFDARFWSASRVGSSVWACHHVADTAGGVAKTRWYEFEMNGWPVSGLLPYLRQTGTIDPGDGVYAAFPSIAADEGGSAYLAFTRSSANEYLSIARCYRSAGDPPGQMSPPVSLVEGAGPYHGDRWGDYSGTVPDPDQPGTFWTHQEWAPSAAEWATWVAAETIQTTSSAPGSGGPDRAWTPTASRIGALVVSPNPAPGQTHLTLDLGAAGHAQLFVHDIRGRAVRHWPNVRSTSGRIEVTWDGSDQVGRPVASGVYFVTGLPAGAADGQSGAWSRSTRVVLTR
ncbi:MAG: hypothetical protein R3E97_22770 [Candidatus Eisenbacteria bacterium]